MRFRRIAVKTRIRGASIRNPPELNVSGTEEVLELAAESGFDPEGLAVAFGVQERSQSIAVYLAHSGDLGAVAVKKNKKDRTFTLCLHGVFEEVPRLRPSARRRFPVARTVDAEGEACLVISLNASLRRGRLVGSGAKSEW